MAYRDVILNDNPTAYWRFGESSGSTAVDETANNHDATYLGDPTLGVTGVLVGDSDTAIETDGTDDGASPGDAFDPQAGGSFSVEAWIHPDDVTNSQPIFHKDSGGEGGWQLQLAGGPNTGDVRFYLRDSGGAQILDTPGGVVSTGAWHHIVGVYDSSSGTLLIYVDAVEQASMPVTGGAYSATTKELGLACNYDGSSVLESLDGTNDEYAVFPSALTATQIQEHYDEATIGTAETITFDPHTVVLNHMPQFEGRFSPHVVVLNHFKAVPLQPHFINLSHFGNTAKSDDSEQGQATALRKLLGYGWGMPDPAGSANEKIETPRESWPIHRFHEAERLLRQEGVEEPTAQALGDALRRLGEDIHLDVKENLQRYEWHANAHTHSALGGAGTTPIGPADSVFLCGGSLRRYRADNGNLVWSVGSNLDRMALDHVNEVIFATKQGSSSSDVDKVEAYDFGGSLVWSSDPFLNVTDSKNDHLTICLSRDRESLYMIYHKDNNEIGVIRLRTADGSVETVGSSTGFSTDGLPNNVVIDTINDFLYVTDGYGQDDGRVIKLSLGDGKFKWKTALNHSGSSSSSICATETLIWAMAGNELYALDPSDGSIVDSTLFSVNDYTGVKITKIWKDFQNSNSVYVLTASRFDPISWLHRAYLVGDTIQADEELYTFEESNADILARDAEGSFYITGGSQATTQLQIYKLNPDLNLAWQRDGNATEILTAQGRSVHWG